MADADLVEDPELRGMFHAWFAYALEECLRFGEAVEEGEKALELGREAYARAASFEDDYIRFKSGITLGMALLAHGDFTAAETCFGEVVDYGMRTGKSRAIAVGYGLKAYLFSYMGRMDEADQLFALAFDYSRDDY